MPTGSVPGRSVLRGAPALQLSGTPEEGQHRKDAAVALRRLVEPQLREDLANMRLDRPVGDDQPPAYALVRQTLGDKSKDLPLALAECLDGVIGAMLVEQSRHDGRVDDGLRLGHPPEAVDEDVSREDPLFEDVADAFGLVLDET